MLDQDTITKAREALLADFDNWAGEFPRAFDEQSGKLSVKFSLKFVGYDGGQINIAHEISFDQKPKIKDKDMIVVNPVQKRMPGM